MRTPSLGWALAIFTVLNSVAAASTSMPNCAVSEILQSVNCSMSANISRPEHS